MFPLKRYKLLIFLFFFFVVTGCSKKNEEKLIMEDLSSKTKMEIEEYAQSNYLDLQIEYQYSDTILKDKVISQSILPGEEYLKNVALNVTISLGNIKEVYKEKKVNEVGRIPVMMYHGIVSLKDEETPYIGGNVDKDGYHRTTESFRRDLEFYYKQGYRMISLNDYIDGKIDVPLGYSPIVLTFDDGLPNSIHIIGKDENGNLIIDPECAVGILEEYKQKYPDYQVTATFFVNGGLFQQSNYNEEILKWLVTHGYDVGNHSYSHPNFNNLTKEEASIEIGRVYNLLDNIIPNQYVSIVALPYGSPGKKTNASFEGILSSSYNGKNYQTKSTLQVGWESNYSPFSKQFDVQFIKRIRAYDNNGFNFDITYSFQKLEQNRYISDGNSSQIVIPLENQEYLKNNLEFEIITY